MNNLLSSNYNDNIRKCKKFILNICMATPAIIFIYFGINYLFGNNKLSGYFLLVLIISFYSIGILKDFFKYIMTDKTYLFFGSGLRPDGAINTGIFNDDAVANTYGMPSGHSLLIVVVATYWSLYFNKKQEYYKSLLLIIMALIVMKSRILLGCHTKQQVIIGGIFGFIIGILANYCTPLKVRSKMET